MPRRYSANRLPSLCALFSLLWLGCSDGAAGPGFDVPERPPGRREPAPAACTETAPRCLLPWPSNAHTAADAGSATGLRVRVEPASLVAPDDPGTLNLADGFSLVTPLVAVLPGELMPLAVAARGDGPVRLLLAQPGAPGFASSVPLRFELQPSRAPDSTPETFLFGYPLRPLAAQSDYVAVILDDVPVAAGPRPAPRRDTEVMLGLAAPETLAEAQLAAYHAPTRAVIRAAGIDPRRVVRAWDFTTRSQGDALRRLTALRAGVLAAVRAGRVAAQIDKVDSTPRPFVAMIVEGHLEGLPKYIEPEPASALRLDAAGLPVAIGTRTAPFRIVVPAGTRDYPFLMYGHGTGGTYADATFDSEIAGQGAAKVGIQFDGWTEGDVVQTLVGFKSIWSGSHFAGAMLMQALADAAAVQALMPGALGDALAAPQIKGATNPAAGRRPTAARTLWAGGSLGGIMSLVAVCADSELRYGVLNVPGAAWTHYIPKSVLFSMILPLLQAPYRGEANAHLALAMSQGIWDEIDGAAWSTALRGREAAFLVQESIGDPVVPNEGSEMVAVVTAARQLGAELVKVAAGLPAADAVSGYTSALTQYRVASTQPYRIHGFAGDDTPAGRAARQQIADFVRSIWSDGRPAITVPAGCMNRSCDFSGTTP
jgi:hypothetical protein